MPALLLRVHRRWRAPPPSASRAGAARFVRAAGGCAAPFRRPGCSVPTAIAPGRQRFRPVLNRLECGARFDQAVESASTRRWCSSCGPFGRCRFCQDASDVIQCRAFAFRPPLLRFRDERGDLLIAESPRPLRDFRQGQMLLLEKPDHLDARNVALGVPRSRPRRSGRWQQALLDVEVHRSRRHVCPFTQFVDVEITQTDRIITVQRSTVKYLFIVSLVRGSLTARFEEPVSAIDAHEPSPD